MKRYQVKVSVAADRDLQQIQAFLLSVLSKRGAFRYVVNNKRWTYVFHIEDDTVVVDRILPSKMIKG